MCWQPEEKRWKNLDQFVCVCVCVCVFVCGSGGGLCGGGMCGVCVWCLDLHVRARPYEACDG
jgi:hypothetical protein